MSDDERGNRKVTILPPFQSYLVKKLPEIDECYKIMLQRNPDPRPLWGSLASLYRLSPEDVHADLEAMYSKAEKGMEEIPNYVMSQKKPLILGKNSIRQVIDYNSKVTVEQYRNIYLLKILPDLTRSMIRVLDEAGYIKEIRGYGDVPKSTALGRKKKDG